MAAHEQSTESIQLQNLSIQLSDDSPDAPNETFSLPPVDEGRDAWLCLFGCFIIESLVWGFPASFGIFQEYYTSHAPFSEHASGIAAIGTTSLGIIYLSGPLMFGGLAYWPHVRKHATYLGLLCMTVALVASSFANAVWQLLLTQGVLYAIGGSLLYSPTVTYVDEWFVRRKGLAYGVMWAGSGFVGASIPYLMSWVLERWSFRTALRMWAIVLVLLVLPFLQFTRPRVPVTAASSTPRPRFNFSFLKSRLFIIYSLGNMIEGLGYFLPSIWLPTYARSIGSSNTIATATLALLNASAVLGCIILGLVIDRTHITTAILLSTIGALLSVFVFWGLASSTGMLLAFAITYGFFAGSFSTTWSGIIREVMASKPDTHPSLVFGFLAMGRGIGSICSGPVSDALVHMTSSSGRSKGGYLSDYNMLIIMTGVTAAIGGLSWGARRFTWI
jgi:MFS family permease